MKHKNTSLKEYRIRINKVLHYINENYNQKMNLAKLAEESCFSPFHFHRIFTSIVNETPNNYINRIKIEKAAYFLKYHLELPITEIALNCGFESSAAFARSFKNHFKVSASQWREINSKNCKTDSNISEELKSPDNYFVDVNLLNSQKKLEYEMYIEVREMPEMTLAYVVHHEGYNEKIEKAFDKLCTWAGPRGLLAGDVKIIGISWDNPEITPKDKCRYYACITVPEKTEVSGEVSLYKIPACRCIVSKFQGEDKGINPQYNYLYETHLPQSGYQPADIPAFEIYYKDPNDEPVGQFDMDICVPVIPL